MSRKINSNLLKKNKIENWPYVNISKTNEEIPFYLYRNSVILNVLKKLFAKSKIFILNCKIYQTNSLLHIFLSYINGRTKNSKQLHNQNRVEDSLFVNKLIKSLDNYTKNKLNFYIIVQNIQKYIIQLKQFNNYTLLKKKLYLKFKKYENKYAFLKTLLQIFFIIVTKPNSAQLLADYIGFIYKLKIYRKDHLRLFKLFKTITKTLLASKISIISGIKIIIGGRINGFARSRSRFFQHGGMPLNTFDVKIDYAYNTSFTVNGTLGIKVWIFEKK